MAGGATSIAARQALADEILCIADSKLVFAHWCYKVLPNARSLTDFISVGAAAETGLRSTRQLWRALDGLGRKLDFIEFQRPVDSLHSMDLLDRAPLNWEDFVACCYMVESAGSELLASLDGEALPGLSATVQRIRREEEVHDLYFRGWIKNGNEIDRTTLCRAFTARIPAAVRWFGAPTGKDLLADEGLRAWSASTARGRFLERLHQLLSEAGLDGLVDVTAAASAVEWTDWNAARRRCDRPLPRGLASLLRSDHPLALLARRPARDED